MRQFQNVMLCDADTRVDAAIVTPFKFRETHCNQMHAVVEPAALPAPNAEKTGTVKWTLLAKLGWIEYAMKHGWSFLDGDYDNHDHNDHNDNHVDHGGDMLVTCRLHVGDMWWKRIRLASVQQPRDAYGWCATFPNFAETFAVQGLCQDKAKLSQSWQTPTWAENKQESLDIFRIDMGLVI